MAIWPAGRMNRPGSIWPARRLWLWRVRSQSYYSSGVEYRCYIKFPPPWNLQIALGNYHPVWNIYPLSHFSLVIIIYGFKSLLLLWLYCLNYDLSAMLSLLSFNFSLINIVTKFSWPCSSDNSHIFDCCCILLLLWWWLWWNLRLVIGND